MSDEGSFLPAILKTRRRSSLVFKVDLVRDLSKKPGESALSNLEDPEDSTATVTSGIKFPVRKKSINLSNQATSSGTRRLSQNLVASADPALLCAKALQHLVGDVDNKVVQNVRRRSRTFEHGSICLDGLVGYPPHPDDVLTSGNEERAKLKLSAENVAVQLEHLKLQGLAWAFFSIWLDVVKARKETRGTVQFVPQCRYCPSELLRLQSSGMSDEDLIKEVSPCRFCKIPLVKAGAQEIISESSARIVVVEERPRPKRMDWEIRCMVDLEEHRRQVAARIARLKREAEEKDIETRLKCRLNQVEENNRLLQEHAWEREKNRVGKERLRMAIKGNRRVLSLANKVRLFCHAQWTMQCSFEVQTVFLQSIALHKKTKLEIHPNVSVLSACVFTLITICHG
mmetsp:Transcript_7909/g.16853  ORF Transcript_7909/g.16853 Transcript_7909/m.16853 type:complete len:399 (-) Transcript_7909:1778-2974(-)